MRDIDCCDITGRSRCSAKAIKAQYLPDKSLRWLQPPDTDERLGFYQGDEVAKVWPVGLKGNTAAKWHWIVPPKDAAGVVEGTGDEAVDAFAAQSQANTAFFKN